VTTVGVLHPGQMGASIGAALRPKVADVLWVDAGRSYETTKRAEWADLVAVRTRADLVARCDVIVSVCPPNAALDVAHQVAAAAEAGADHTPLYVDANAIAPATAVEIAGVLGAERVVDGGIIGPPAWKPGHTVLHLSGVRAAEVADLFDGTSVEARVVGDVVGQASAVKACFALQSKAMPAIWALVAALAAEHGVEEPVRQELARDQVDLDERLGEIVRRATAKAWRWEGEMSEAARALADAGLPDGVSMAAAEVYRRIAAGVDRSSSPDPAAWLAALRRNPS
jgi:3-hydroxyisobutyrate dehydrogenase-like beta-hydroxyacid dehydrogenase